MNTCSNLIGRIVSMATGDEPDDPDWPDGFHGNAFF